MSSVVILLYYSMRFLRFSCAFSIITVIYPFYVHPDFLALSRISLLERLTTLDYPSNVSGVFSVAGLNILIRVPNTQPMNTLALDCPWFSANDGGLPVADVLLFPHCAGFGVPPHPISG